MVNLKMPMSLMDSLEFDMEDHLVILAEFRDWQETGEIKNDAMLRLVARKLNKERGADVGYGVFAMNEIVEAINAYYANLYFQSIGMEVPDIV